MKSLLLLLALGLAQPLEATITLLQNAQQHHFRREKPKDRPKLNTYHCPSKVFAPVHLGRENAWSVFALGLVFLGGVGQFLTVNGESSLLMAIVLASALLFEIIIILCHPIIWLIRWIRLLHWQRVWRKRHRLCPGQ